MNPKFFRLVISPSWQFLHKQKTNYYIKEFRKSELLPQEQIEIRNWNELKRLIKFCEANVSYYKKMFRRLGITSQDIASVADYKKLPIQTKEIVRERYNEFLPDVVPGKFGTTKTSGSTGTSIEFRISNQASERWYAAKIRGRMWHGVYFGDPILWIWGHHRNQLVSSLRQRLISTIRNEYYVSAFDISAEHTSNIANTIRQKKISAIYGYSSAIYEFCLIMQGQGLSLPLKKVFVTAEKLYDDQRELIQKVFQCSVVMEYGAAEMGILAFECPDRQLHVIEENVFLETVESGYGETKRIIVTDLYNYAMPLLRYESGDLTSGISPNKCSCGRTLLVINDVIGRHYDMIRLSNGKVIHGEMINYLVKEVTLKEGSVGIVHQFVQRSYNDYSLYLAASHLSKSKQEALRTEFLRGFRQYVGEGYCINLEIAFVDKIERPETGKHRYIISNVPRKR